MHKLNLYFGIFLFVIFLLTGYYLMAYFTPDHVNDHSQRLQIRSNHIYILFIALLNIVIYKWRLSNISKIGSYLVHSARLIIIMAGIISFLAFCYDHTGNIDHRTFTFIAVVLSLSSVVLLMLTDSLNLFSVVKQNSKED